MVDDPIDLDQARTLLQAIDAPIDGLASPLAFDDLLVRVAASARTVVHDWRGELEEGLEAIASVVAHDGHDIQYELGEDGARAVVRCGGRAADIKCVPADDDDFKDVAATVERLLDGSVQFRSTVSGLESDTYELVGLPATQWAALDRAIPSLVRRVFPPTTPSSPQKPDAPATKKPGFLRRLFGG